MRIQTLLAIGMVAGCADQPRTPTDVRDLNAAEYHAARRIAEARCDRQVGACARYSSREACVESKLLPSARDANLLECNGPVDEDRLTSCVSEIRASPCASGIVDLEDCNDAQLCTVVEEGTL